MTRSEIRPDPAHSARALVLRTAGINCDGETVEALSRAGAEVDLVHLHRVLDEPARLDEVELLVVPGGFSYGDDVAAGRVFGLELRHRLRAELGRFVDRGGFVVGVCNGFQVLLDAGLFTRGSDPDLPRGASPSEGTDTDRKLETRRDVALVGNASNRFECRWVTLRAERCPVPWLEPGQLFPVPIAHAEGRLVARDAAALQRLEDEGLVAFRYVSSDGSPAGGYPDNPNGSVADIAGICDPSGRVLGLMPHPERNITPWQHPHWTRLAQRDEGEGLAFWRHLVEATAGAPA